MVPVRNQLKAIYAGAVAGLTGLGVAMQDGVTAQEWVGIALATLIAYGGVYGLNNRTDAEGNPV